MSLSHEWFEFHLTPNGWVDGSCRIDFSGVQEKDTPEDSLLSIRIHERLPNPSGVVYDKEIIFSSENQELLDSAIDKYGEIPPRYTDNF